MVDYHKLLKIPKGAGKEEIKKAYRRFAFQFHPDRSKHHGDLFLIVHEAYEALMKEAEAGEGKIIRATDAPSHPPPPPPRPKKPVKHDMSFVRGKIKREQVWAPDFHLVRRPKITVESNQCPLCEGYGIIPNKFKISMACPRCRGTGHKTRIVY